jgi:hypothetical protein
MMEKSEKGYPIRQADLKNTIELGFSILEKAAREKDAPGS